MPTFLCDNRFYLHENKKLLSYQYSFAISLALKQRLGTTRKWPILCSTAGKSASVIGVIAHWRPVLKM